MMLLLSLLRSIILVPILTMGIFLFVVAPIPSLSGNELSEYLKIVRPPCKDGFHFDSVEQFTKEFMPAFSETLRFPDSKLPNIDCYTSSFKAIKALDELLRGKDTIDVCQPEHINKIIGFHNLYMVQQPMKSKFGITRRK